MREMLTAADTGKFGRVDTTVGHLLERWFEQAQTDFLPDTVTEVRGYLDRILLPGLGHLPLAKLGAADLDRFYLQLRTNGDPTSEPHTAAAIHRVHRMIHRALTQAVKWGWLTSNPANNASPRQVPAAEGTTPIHLDVPFLPERFTQRADDENVGRLPSRDEILAGGSPFPPYGELVMDGLTDEEEQAFLKAMAEA